MAKALNRSDTDFGVRSARPDKEPGVLSSGVDTVDVATGVGGWPEGRFAILHGPEGCGKTTLALLAVAECQRQGGVAVYLDFEAKIDHHYVEALGVDLDALILSTPLHIERGFNFIEKCLTLARRASADCPVLFVWDSLHAGVGKKRYAIDYEEGHFNPETAAYSHGLSKLIPKLFLGRGILLGISQVRMKLDGFKAREKVGVGNAPLFYASMIAKLRATKPKGNVKKGRTGEQVTVRFVKNQVAVPFSTAEYHNVYGTGPDVPASTLLAAEMVGLSDAPTKGGIYRVEWPIGSEGKTQEAKLQLGGMQAWAAKNPAPYEALRAAVRAGIGRPVEEVADEPEAGEGDEDGE